MSRGNRALGLLIRSFQAGTGTPRYYHRSAILPAYFANVRSVLEYCSVVWAGAANSHTVRVDRVQHEFLIWLLAHSSFGYANSLSYDDLLHHFRMSSLASRRVQRDLLFLRNIIRGKVDCQTLLKSFPLHVPPQLIRTVSLLCSVPGTS